MQGIINAEDSESVEDSQIAEFYRHLVGAGTSSESWAKSRELDAATEERCILLAQALLRCLSQTLATHADELKVRIGMQAEQWISCRTIK